MMRSSDYSKSATPTHRRGSMLIYVALLIPALCGIVSLAVDLGRAYAARTQLQAAVDSATRAAAQEIVNFKSNAVATATATSVAARNLVEGQPVVLQSGDVSFGYWNTATKTFVVNGSPSNAIRVTAIRSAARGNAIATPFCAMLGRSSVDIRATAIALMTQEIAPFNATGDITFNHTGLANGGDWHTDSYIGNVNSYSAGTSRMNGNVLSNGSITYNFTTPANGQPGWNNRITNTAQGEIFTANGQDVTRNWTRKATGNGQFWVEYGGWNNDGSNTTRLPASGNFPAPKMPDSDTTPADASTYLSGSNPNGLRDLVISNGSNITLPAGTYCLNSISLTNGSTVTFDGPAVVNVSSSINLDNGVIKPQVLDPKYLKVNVCTQTGSTGTINIKNLPQDLYMDLNAPQANLTYTHSNNGNSMFGRLIAKNMTFNCTGNGGIHGNESLLRSFVLVK